MKQFRFFFLLSILLIFSCGGGSSPNQAAGASEKDAATEETVKAVDAPVSEIPESEEVDSEAIHKEALISFLTGDVFILRGNDEFFAEIGDMVTENDRIRTGIDGFCELQIGSVAIVSIQEDTDFTLATVSLHSEKNIVKSKILTGTVAFKVNKLIGDDSFNITAPGVVCGVRGTQFLINVDDKEETGIAVAEGRVALVPPVTEKLEKLKDETVSKELVEVIENVLKIETVVEAGEEIAVEAEDFTEVAEHIKIIVDEVQKIVEKVEEAAEEETVTSAGADEVSEGLSEELEDGAADESAEKIPGEETVETREIEPELLLAITELITKIETVAVDIEDVVEVAPEPEVIRVANVEILKPLKTREFLPVRKKAGPAAAEKEAVEKPIQYGSIEISTIPENAEIFIDDHLRGTGSISALYPVGTEIKILLKAEGYDDLEESVTVENIDPVTRTFSLKQSELGILIRTEPAGAEIFLDGDSLGTGTFTGSYPIGTALVFTARYEGYNPGSVEALVAPDGPGEYIITLGRGPREFTLKSFPEDSEIFINGESAGAGTSSGEYPFGEKVSVGIRKEGYQSVERTFVLNESVPNEVSIRLEPVNVPLTISSVPGDARISINGKPAGKGRVATSSPFGSRVNLVLERRGYEPETCEIMLSTPNPVSREISLKALPVYGEYSMGEKPLVGTVMFQADRIAAADRDGYIHGINLDGAEKWSADSTNRNNEAAFPVITGDSLFFAGTKKFASYSMVRGSVISEKTLGADDALPFGNRPAVAGSTIVYPEQSGLRFLDAGDFSEKGFLALPELIMTTPAVKGDLVYVVDFVGTLHAVSLSDYSIIRSTDTPLKQPAGLTLTIDEERGFIGDTKGRIVAVNLDDGEVLWSAKLSRRITSDIAVGGGKVFVFSDNAIHALSALDGSVIGGPYTDASTRPFVRDGRLYYGSKSGSLIVRDISGGNLIYEQDLGCVPSAAPAAAGKFVAVGLSDGSVVVLNEEAFGL